VSNLVAFGEVSAEEAQRDEQQPVVEVRTPAPVARLVARRPAAAAPQLDGYQKWLLSMTALAGRGTAALMAAWNESPLDYRRQLTNTDLRAWQDLKAKAATCA
jgi:hypothetical protein